MKKVHLFVGLIFAFITVSCSLNQMMKLAKEQKIQQTPNPLEVHKDTVNFSISGNLPVKMMKKGLVYTMNTFYKYGDAGKEIAFDPIQFKGEDYPDNKTQPVPVTKSFSFPYKEEYKSGTVEIQGTGSKGSSAKKTERLPIGTGVITTSKWVQKSYYVAFAKHGYNSQDEYIPVVIPDFYFEKGKAVLRPAELKSAKAQQLDAFIASKNVTRTVTITGTHSPEGQERINSKLSEDRAKVIEKFYRDEMKKYDYKGQADSIKFILKPVVDDWSLLQEKMKDYTGISDEEKTAIQQTIQAGENFEATEKKLQGLKGYKKLYNDIYPSLRKAQTEILTKKQKKTQAEISSLASQITAGQAPADALTFDELMYAATLTPLAEEKTKIYEVAVSKQADWVSHNNLGAAYLQKALAEGNTQSDWLDKAKAQLDLAGKINPASAEVNANLASITLLKGNPYRAAAYAAKALQAEPSNETRLGVNGIKGACEIYKAKYGNAVNTLQSATATDVNLFNKGLAHLLNKEYAKASSVLMEATQKNANMSIAYYCAAVAAARNNNADAVSANLAKAVKINPSLKETALADLEFAKYNSTESFKNVLK